METKPIPTVEQFLNDYFKEINPNFKSYKKAIELLSAAGRHEVIRIRTSQAAHEYAVLFAKYHVKEALDRCVEIAPYDKGRYEEAYPEYLIK